MFEHQPHSHWIAIPHHASNQRDEACYLGDPPQSFPPEKELWLTLQTAIPRTRPANFTWTTNALIAISAGKPLRPISPAMMITATLTTSSNPPPPKKTPSAKKPWNAARSKP